MTNMAVDHQSRNSAHNSAAVLDIACVIPSLGAGGAERVLASLASQLSERGHRIAVITLLSPGMPPFYPLADSVELLPVGGLATAAGSSRPSNIAKAAWRIRRALKSHDPKLVLGFTTLGSVLAVLASRGLRMPVVAAERVDPQGHGQRIGRLRTTIRNALYARAEHVVVQTTRARQALSWLGNDGISIIANPVHCVAGQAHPDKSGPDVRFRILGVGRLDAQKGFDLLISAFGRVSQRFPDWDLVIHGDGPERAALEALARRIPAGRIKLPGITPEIEAAFLGAHALAFPSRYEGFPNALAEAMAAGLPVLGFRDVSGVEELIVTAPPAAAATGLLADPASPIDSLTHGLVQLMEDPTLRTQLGASARHHVAAFSPQVHYEQWERLLTRVAQANARR